MVLEAIWGSAGTLSGKPADCYPRLPLFRTTILAIWAILPTSFGGPFWLLTGRAGCAKHHPSPLMGTCVGGRETPGTSDGPGCTLDNLQNGTRSSACAGGCRSLAHGPDPGASCAGSGGARRDSEFLLSLTYPNSVPRSLARGTGRGVSRMPGGSACAT